VLCRLHAAAAGNDADQPQEDEGRGEEGGHDPPRAGDGRGEEGGEQR